MFIVSVNAGQYHVLSIHHKKENVSRIVSDNGADYDCRVVNSTSYDVMGQSHNAEYNADDFEKMAGMFLSNLDTSIIILCDEGVDKLNELKSFMGGSTGILKNP